MIIAYLIWPLRPSEYNRLTFQAKGKQVQSCLLKMILAFYRYKNDNRPLSFVSEFAGYSVLHGEVLSLLSILDGSKKDDYEGSFLVDNCNILEDDFLFAKISLEGTAVHSSVELKEGLNLDQISSSLAKYQSEHNLTPEATANLSEAIKHIYNTLLARPLYTILDLSKAEPTLKAQVNELSHLIFAHYQILVYLGEEIGEPRISGYDEEPAKPVFHNDFEDFAYGEAAQQAGFRFFVGDITDAKKLTPGSMFVEAAKKQAKAQTKKKAQTPASYFKSSFTLNIPFAILFLLFGFASSFIFYYLAKGEYNGTVASIFSLLSPIFALMALMPVAFFYGDSAERNVFKNKVLLGGLTLIGVVGLLFGGIEYLFFRTTDFPFDKQLPFLLPLICFPLIEAAFVFVLSFIRKKKAELEP